MFHFPEHVTSWITTGNYN